MYRYETHLHTAPVSKCAKARVRECVEFYKKQGYQGIFVTNHFIDGNINVDSGMLYAEKIDFYFSDYEEAKLIGDEIGIDVFCGVEMSYKGTDFLVYGLDKEWYASHPEIDGMKKSVLLPLLRENGALVVQAHPFREARYIDHIRLFPRCVDGVEVYNAGRTDFENLMALQYAENYNLLKIAGSDNHYGGLAEKLGGVEFDTPLRDELDFVERVKSGSAKCFAESVVKKEQ